MLALVLGLIMFAALLVMPASSDGAPPLGSLTQLESPFNCVGEEGYHEEVIGCGTLLPAEALNSTYEAQVSPDGKNVYSVAVVGALVEYSRNASNGALTPIGCITAGAKPCASENVTENAIAMANPAAIAISPDGKNAYVVTKGGNALVEFSRNAETGLLTEIGCISGTNTECTSHEAKGVNNPYDVSISPHGENVYVTGYEKESVAEFSRNPATGLLTQLAFPNNCISGSTAAETGCSNERALGLKEPIGLVMSPGGENVYVAGGGTEGKGSIAVFAREPSGALKQLAAPNGCISTFDRECAPGIAINGPEDLVVSPDGRNVYANSNKNNAVLEFRRESSGALKQLAAPNTCIMTPKEEVSLEADCSEAKGLERTLGVAISPDGENVYASSSVEDDEAAFDRNAETGALTPLPAPYECAGKSDTEEEVEEGKTEEEVFNACGTQGIFGIAEARRVTVSPDGKNLYVAGQLDHAIVELKRAVPEPESTPGSGESPGKTTISTLLNISPPGPGLPEPLLARTGNIAPVSGSVSIRMPGTSRFVPLATVTQIPFGTVIDAMHGTVSVTTAEPGKTIQTGEFFDGEFTLKQTASGLVIAELTGGNFSVCPTARERAHKAGVVDPLSDLLTSGGLWMRDVGGPQAQAAASGSHVVRKLWANAHGKFETKGNYAAGAVQGTEWLTEDLCDGTLIKVTRDKVAVTNLVNHRKVEVKTGHHYLAKAPRA
jgi:DNA-binding beta-propeller fold protein YncE